MNKWTRFGAAACWQSIGSSSQAAIFSCGFRFSDIARPSWGIFSVYYITDFQGRKGSLTLGRGIGETGNAICIQPKPWRKTPGLCLYRKNAVYFRLSATATATATVAPTMGLLPMPKKPIISTWAGTELDPANWASECIRPMVSVMP